MEEIVGYHLERAYRYRTELTLVDEGASTLARRAAARLASAGGRALLRSEMPAAVSLLARAAELLPVDAPERFPVLFDLAEALMAVGELGRARATAEDAVRTARASRDERAELHASIALSRIRLATDPDADTADVRTVVERSIAALEELADDRGLADAFYLLGVLEDREGRGAGMQAALERALEHARRAGDERREKNIVVTLGDALIHGPAPVEELQALVEWQLEWGRAIGNRFLEADGHLGLAWLYPMMGRFEEARTEVAHVKDVFDELGASIWDRLDAAYAAATLERLAGEPVAAETELRFVYESFRKLGRSTGRFALVTAELTLVLYEQGRDEEAREFVDVSAAAVRTSGGGAEALRAAAAAKLLSRRGQSEEAVAHAREAVALADRTDSPNLRGRVRCALGEVLLLADRPGETSPILEEATLLFDQKGNVPSAEQARRLADPTPARARGLRPE